MKSVVRKTWRRMIQAAGGGRAGDGARAAALRGSIERAAEELVMTRAGLTFEGSVLGYTLAAMRRMDATDECGAALEAEADAFARSLPSRSRREAVLDFAVCRLVGWQCLEELRADKGGKSDRRSVWRRLFNGVAGTGEGKGRDPREAIREAAAKLASLDGGGGVAESVLAITISIVQGEAPAREAVEAMGDEAEAFARGNSELTRDEAFIDFAVLRVVGSRCLTNARKPNE